MRAKIRVEGSAPDFAHQMALDIEQALERAEERQGGPRISKAIFIDRMTDAECAVFDTMLDVVTPRARQKWYAISALYLRAPDFSSFKAELEDAFGVERTAVLLKPTD